MPVHQGGLVSNAPDTFYWECIYCGATKPAIAASGDGWVSVEGGSRHACTDARGRTSLAVLRMSRKEFARMLAESKEQLPAAIVTRGKISGVKGIGETTVERLASISVTTLEEAFAMGQEELANTIGEGRAGRLIEAYHRLA